jgi:hypothetical protein
MADFALWAAACETALWPAGTFWSAYCGNRDEALGVIEADPIAAAICSLMSRRTVWTQTATELLITLAEVAGERVGGSKTWPANARALAGWLRRAATFLRKIGIEISFVREGRARTRIIRIANTGHQSGPEYGAAPRSVPSASSAQLPKSNATGASARSSLRMIPSDADDLTDANDREGAPTVRETPKNSGETTTDGADATSPPQSKPSERQPQWRARI